MIKTYDYFTLNEIKNYQLYKGVSVLNNILKINNNLT